MSHKPPPLSIDTEWGTLRLQHSTQLIYGYVIISWRRAADGSSESASFTVKELEAILQGAVSDLPNYVARSLRTEQVKKWLNTP